MRNDETKPNAQMTKEHSEKALRPSDFGIDSGFDIRASSFPNGLIASPAQLERLLPLIERNGRVAADTEADSLHCYCEKLCLVQISLPEGDFLVDPLAENDLCALAELLAWKEIILHGADYDLRLLRRAWNFQAQHLFDSALAARLLGEKQFSYATLVEKFFGVQLAKGSQKANWALRPLSPRMESYARNDTHYLLPLAEKLEADLKGCGRWEWFQQSCARAIELAATDRDRTEEEAWRIRGSGLIRGRAAAILRELWNWRDQEARQFDRPPFHVLRNEQLLQSAEDAAAGKAVNYPHFSERRRRSFRAALEKALALPEEDWPQFIRKRADRPTREMEDAAQQMREKRDQAAHALGLEPSFLAPRGTIDAIAAEPARAKQSLAPWQRELLGL